MPSITHESLVELFRDCPALAPELFRHAGKDIPGHIRPRITSAEFTDLDAAEYRADVVIRLDGRLDGPNGIDDRPGEAVIVEVQLDRDGSKRFSWPLYIAGVRARFGCPATLLVIAVDDGVAAWCARPIAVDRNDSLIRPMVLGPRELPRITDVDRARAFPELAVLSAAAHGLEEDAADIAIAALDACQGLDTPRSTRYADFVLSALGDAARAALENHMSLHKYEYRSDFARKYFAQGRAEGLREVLRGLLVQRFGDLPASVPDRIDQAEIEDLERWMGRVIPAATLSDVFRDD